MSNAQILPPKMLAQYVDLAKRGQCDHHVGADIYEFYRGNQVISVIGIDPPCTGTVRKVASAEMELLKAKARPAAELSPPGDKK